MKGARQRNEFRKDRRLSRHHGELIKPSVMFVTVSLKDGEAIACDCQSGRSEACAASRRGTTIGATRQELHFMQSTASHDVAGTKQPQVLVVDDDPEITAMLSRYLGGQGFQVRIAADGSQVRAAMQAPAFDVVLLDLGLPDEDGLGLMRELRSVWQGPVIIVSGRGESVERVVGLELGADDYVSKPFDLRELLARIRSVLRRAQPAPAPVQRRNDSRYLFDGLQLNSAARHLIGRTGEDINLTGGEFELLQVLLEHPHRVLSRDELMNAVHGRDSGPFDRSVDMQIGRLRRKVELDPANPRLIKAVRGAGYLFAGKVQRG